MARALSLRRGWFVALLVWVAFVWSHSLASGDVSGAESGFFVSLLRPLLMGVGITDPGLMSFVVRKCAHFSEYAVLGILVWGNLWCRQGEALSRRLGFLILGLAVPFLDESIQLLVPGRAGMLRDVLIDLSGLCVGLIVGWLVTRRKR